MRGGAASTYSRPACAAGLLSVATALVACAGSAVSGSGGAQGGGAGEYVSYGQDGSEVSESLAGAPADPAGAADMDGRAAELEVATLRERGGHAGAAMPSPAPPPVPDGLRGAKAKVDSSESPAAADAARDSAAPETHRLALVYEARVHLAVFETEQAIDAAEKLARDSGGYLVHRDDRSISFRVPSATFQASLAAALALGDVLHREVTVKDVTEEFRDLRVRLRNAEAVRDRLEQLLARADEVAEALQVERELERVAAEIERIKGRLALLEELTSFSTITLQFRPPRPIDKVDSQVRLPFPWLFELGLPELLRL